ncbi:MAG: phospholipase D-like domain-containing protein [Thermoanaerobaculia bacterium]
MRRGGGGSLFGGPRLVLLALLCLQASGCTVVTMIVGTEKREVYKFDHPFTVSDPDFRRSAEALGTPMVGGNAVRLLENGDEIFPSMTRDIREAKKSVNLETYIFQPDRAGRQFADAMIAAAKNGVEVRLLVDAWGSKLKDLTKELKDAGVHVRRYRPVRLFSIYKVGRRTHRKILVVDGSIAYTGGLGIDERWLGNARNSKEWRDTQVRCVGPAAAQMQAIFSEDWTFTTGEILAGEKFYPKIDPAGDTLGQAIKASRGDSTSLAKMLYYVAIQSAAKSIHIQNAYFLPDNQVREALVNAVKRGVDVQVMVPGRHIDLPMVRSASWLHYGDLLEGGVRIWEYVPTMLHNKTMVVDGHYCTIGSINFDARSMSRNAEESMAFYNRDFAVEMEAMFQRDRARCEEITYAKWKHRGLPKRLSEFVFFLFEPYY